MAGKRRTKAARKWHTARNKYNQIKVDYDRMGRWTPIDDIENTAIALEAAQVNLFDTRAPSLDAVCEKFTLYFGKILFDLDNTDSMALLQIISDLRWLERNLHCIEV